MQIFVNLPSQRTLTLSATPSDTIADLKSAIQSRGGPDEQYYQLIHGGKLLDDDGRTLAEYGIRNQFATVNLLPRLLGGGGGKKRKKKVFSTPKKEKKDKEKEKLPVLKLYKVVGGGVLERLRKECPKCEPGNFMADHGDRVSCGKCGLSFARNQPPTPQPAAREDAEEEGKEFRCR
ncbi:unnamed protein product [Linum tenue]|uniref:Ubiquitin-like domain-containing protein n=1 Tax=Linum tenue TaxID=586396 RepID=A0AAV0ND29_9ROSI|nr:unnamed protein product [Linum tenue]